MRYSNGTHHHAGHANYADDDDDADEWDLVFANATDCSGSTHFAPCYEWSTNWQMNEGRKSRWLNRYGGPDGDDHGRRMVNDARHGLARHPLGLVAICGVGVVVVGLNDLRWYAAHSMIGWVSEPAIALMDDLRCQDWYWCLNRSDNWQQQNRSANMSKNLSYAVDDCERRWRI